MLSICNDRKNNKNLSILIIQSLIYSTFFPAFVQTNIVDAGSASKIASLLLAQNPTGDSYK